MEKYGVCNSCQGRPVSEQDLDGFEKTASGDYKCTKCGQVIFTKIVFDDEIQIRDSVPEDNEKKSDI